MLGDVTLLTFLETSMKNGQLYVADYSVVAHNGERLSTIPYTSMGNQYIMQLGS